MSKRRQFKRNIFIACEGRNTERIYFEAIGEETETADHFAVTIYPEDVTEDPTTHALGLINEAKKNIDDFDEVWAVFDKNGYTKHAATFTAANTPVNEKTVHIAFSSISFEQWVLLHFIRSAIAYSKSRDIIEVLHVNGFFVGYEKTAYQETYALLKDRTIVACENAAWLRHQLTQQEILPGTPIHDVNPYTDIDALVKHLLRIDEEIIWISAGQPVPVGVFQLIVVINNTNTLAVTITNGSTQTIVFNTANVATHFYLIDASRQKWEFTIGVTTVIAPGQTATFTLHSAIATSGMSFNYVAGKCRIMMEL